jgi:chitin synthase
VDLLVISFPPLSPTTDTSDSQANFYIAFSILATAMESEAFGLKGINIFNVIINYIYVGLLIMCFILSLGNRPQGAKWFYTIAMIGFSLITIYMTVRFRFILPP